ncbi:MAG: hypothetical protein D4R64_16480 [Porphyromonadaceae bacterium]|nr:MAG: hypothetical protein D4R64_16480 [Porphyromonadaceae bacterium]
MIRGARILGLTGAFGWLWFPVFRAFRTANRTYHNDFTARTVYRINIFHLCSFSFKNYMTIKTFEFHFLSILQRH